MKERAAGQEGNTRPSSALPEALRTITFPDDVGQRHRAEREKVVEEFEALLAQADEELKEAARTAALPARTAAALEEQLHAAVERADGNTEEALRALDDVERARAEADVLRRRLREEGRYDDTVVAERLDTFEGVRVTAGKSRALELDKAERARVWAAKALNVLRALGSYAQTARKGFNGGFYQHCTSNRPGAVNRPHKQLATVESDTTMNRWGAERILTLPSEVDSSGRKEMQAHLKLDSKGSTSPRIYFLDGTKGVTGRVIVGYADPHLTDTKTK
ncbi:hypothetical protein ACFY40_09260 [Streptomyces sp. NPDC012950]|uniref:hypothetical protein n=1 Tax=Streptomyces sp. NPDC012950 TaxID=3364858 RepID=UPI0036C530F6